MLVQLLGIRASIDDHMEAYDVRGFGYSLGSIEYYAPRLDNFPYLAMVNEDPKHLREGEITYITYLFESVEEFNKWRELESIVDSYNKQFNGGNSPH